MLPAVDDLGKIILESQYEMGLSPNGNGGLFDSILKNSAVSKVL